jgi:hypothetical protein
MDIQLWARVEAGTVREITEIDPAGRFHPDFVWVPCGAEVSVGDGFDGEVFLPPPPPEIEATVEDYTRAVQAHLDAAAQARGYDSILSAASYAAVPGPFQAEGTAFATWRSDCWAYCYAQLAAVQAGQRTQPFPFELVAELPARGMP